MNEDIFNMAVRKFLKRVGIASQREIEGAVRAAIESGTLKGRRSVAARVLLSIDDIDLEHEIADEIAFD